MVNKIRVGVSGLHCASCAKIVEIELKKNPGVKSIQVNPLTEEANLEFDEKLFSSPAANKNLKKLGYSLAFPEKITMNHNGTDTAGMAMNGLDDLKNKKTAELKNQKIKLQIDRKSVV